MGINKICFERGCYCLGNASFLGTEPSPVFFISDPTSHAVPSNARNRRSHLLEAKLLVDAADPPHGVYMDGTNVVEPLLTSAASKTEPEIRSMPRTGNSLEGNVSRTSSLIGAVGDEESGQRRLSQGTARMHQVQAYMLEEENRASLVNSFVDWKHGHRERYRGTEEHGGGDSSSLVDETASRYRKREEAGDKVEGRGTQEVESVGKEDGYSEEGEKKFEDEAGEGVKEEKYYTKENKHHSSSTLHLSSHSEQFEEETDEDDEEQDSSYRGPSSGTFRLGPFGIEAEENAEGRKEAQVGPGLHGTDHHLPRLEGGSDVVVSSHYRSEGADHGDKEVVYNYGFYSNTDEDLHYMHSEPGGEDARYERSSHYDVYSTVETLERWLQLKRIDSDTDPRANEVGYLPVKPLNASSMNSDSIEKQSLAWEGRRETRLMMPCLHPGGDGERYVVNPSHDVAIG